MKKQSKKKSSLQKNTRKAARRVTASPKPKPENPQKDSKLCLHSACSTPATSEGYCRLHFIANWKRIRLNDQIKAEKRLNAYVDKLMQKYPKDYMERLKESLETHEKFQQALQQLSVDEEMTAEAENDFIEKFVRDLKIDE